MCNGKQLENWGGVKWNCNECNHKDWSLGHPEGFTPSPCPVRKRKRKDGYGGWSLTFHVCWPVVHCFLPGLYNWNKEFSSATVFFTRDVSGSRSIVCTPVGSGCTRLNPEYIEYSRLNQWSINHDQSAEYQYIDLHITSLYCNQIYPTPSDKPYLEYYRP